MIKRMAALERDVMQIELCKVCPKAANAAFVFGWGPQEASTTLYTVSQGIITLLPCHIYSTLSASPVGGE